MAERSSVPRSSHDGPQPRYPGNFYCITNFYIGFSRTKSVFPPSWEHSRRTIQQAAYGTVRRSLWSFLSVPFTATCTRVGRSVGTSNGRDLRRPQPVNRSMTTASVMTSTFHGGPRQCLAQLPDIRVCTRKKQTYITTRTSNGVRYARGDSIKIRALCDVHRVR